TAGHYTGPSDDQRVTLQVLGQSLKGVFTFEQLTTKNGTKVVRLGFTNVDLFLGDAATNEGLQLTGGFGSFLLTPQGAAGEFGGSVTLTPTLQTRLNGSNISATFNVQFNNLTTAVNEQFTVGGVLQTLKLDGGPFVRVTAFGATPGTGAVLTGPGGTFSTGLYFDRRTSLRADGKVGGSGAAQDVTVTRIAFANLTIGTGTPAGGGDNPGLTEGQGAIVFYSNKTGFAGSVSGHAGGGSANFTLGATVGATINTTGAPVNTTIDVNGTKIVLKLPTSPTR